MVEKTIPPHVVMFRVQPGTDVRVVQLKEHSPLFDHRAAPAA